MSEQWVRKLVANGQLPAEKVGGRWLIRRQDVEAFKKLPPGTAGSARKL
jgi:excisionase family DNA binding protein